MSRFGKGKPEFWEMIIVLLCSHLRFDFAYHNQRVIMQWSEKTHCIVENYDYIRITMGLVQNPVLKKGNDLVDWLSVVSPQHQSKPRRLSMAYRRYIQ